jgi:hypothetical protein
MRVPFVRRTIPVLCLIVFAAAIFVVRAQSGPLDGPGPPPGTTHKPPTEITCLSANIGGEEVHRQLDLPIPVTNRGQIRSAFVRWGQELQFVGKESHRLAGAKMVQDFIVGPTNPPPVEVWSRPGTSVKVSVEATDSYIVGGVCYVLKVWCDPSCWGNGCARARFYYN